MASWRACIAVVLGAGGAARADDFAFSFVGSATRAEGVFSTVNNGVGSLSAISGSLDVAMGGAMGVYSLLPNPSASAPYYSPTGFFIVDNMVQPSAVQPISWYGLLFTNGAGVEINIWSNGAGNPYTFYAHGPDGNVQDSGQFTLTAVPTPGAAGVLGMAGVMLIIGRRRRGA